jgi:hypothetical protein
MLRGLRRCVLVATTATAVTGSFAHEPVKAADLGGDCCADLEERVAELEATTVRKGNKKVSITLYGQVNRAILFWDDHVEKTLIPSTTIMSRRASVSKAQLRSLGIGLLGIA